MVDSAKKFLKALASLHLSVGERAVALLWWHTQNDHVLSLSPGQLTSEIELSGYPAPNTTRLREWLNKDRRTTKGPQGTFRIRIDARATLDDLYKPYIEVEIRPSAGEESSEISSPPTAMPISPTIATAASATSPSKASQATRTNLRLFVGSSVEGLRAAEALQEGLEHDADVTLWSQGVFGLSGGTLETLADKAPEFDFAVLVLTPDDLTIKRTSSRPSARDNVLLELGLFIGALGRRRTFIVHPRDVDMHFPSDLAGVTTATYNSGRSDGNMVAALGPVCAKIRRELTQQGRRK